MGWIAISTYGLVGAAFTASLAYSTSLVYQLVIFLRITGSKLALLLPGSGDVRKARWLWHLYRTKRGNGGSYI